MRQDAAVLDRFLTSSDPFQETQPLELALIGRDVDEIRRRETVLRDQDRGSLALQLAEQFGRLADRD